MKWVVALAVAASLLAGAAHAQPKKMERSVEKQREAVEAWTACIADENAQEVAATLMQDYREDGYKSAIQQLAQKRVSSECFEAMPRAYRQIRLTGLPFAGGLAERMIERDEAPLITRLSMAAIGPEAPTYSYTDQVASCMTRGAPHLVARLFGTEINSEAELASLKELAAVKDVCTSRGAPVEASPLAMRAMLATASFRLLAAQKAQTDA
ncbi:hypothetical protein [Erythrobacter litoralis]|uniref:Uncharacterized protein n=1 Tax=Erythrobacter litoralis (strain HTCC2594) TaxID=314225 RepID=Q2NA70_ERYLH|nr:hypothetical protein [Erythrobacter litoralis]ABC63421.1 hypothetical protein ELI_06645 [Erythrobacter litoralis HTCC2594]